MAKQQRTKWDGKRKKVTKPSTSLSVYSSIPGYGNLFKEREVNETET